MEKDKIPQLEIRTNLNDLLVLPILFVADILTNIALLFGGRATEHLIMAKYVAVAGAIMRKFKRRMKEELDFDYDEVVGKMEKEEKLPE